MIPIAGGSFFCAGMSRFNPKNLRDEKRIISAWRTQFEHVLFSPVHAEIFHQDLRLPDERARLGTGRALTHRAGLRARRQRNEKLTSCY